MNVVLVVVNNSWRHRKPLIVVSVRAHQLASRKNPLIGPQTTQNSLQEYVSDTAIDSSCMYAGTGTYYLIIARLHVMSEAMVDKLHREMRLLMSDNRSSDACTCSAPHCSCMPIFAIVFHCFALHWAVLLYCYTFDPAYPCWRFHNIGWARVAVAGPMTFNMRCHISWRAASVNTQHGNLHATLLILKDTLLHELLTGLVH